MTKRFFTAIFAVSVLFSFAHSVSAESPDAKTAERKKWERWQPAKATTPFEIKYDKNGNGWIEPIERREMLKDTVEEVKKHGKAKVQSPIQTQYDINKNGVIDEIEAKMISPNVD